MDQTITTGKEKVKQICEVLRKETLEPAMDEAKRIIDDAKSSAHELVQEAKAKASKLIADAEKEIEKKEAVFQSSLHQGARQSVDWLKQEIEERVLNQNLGKLLSSAASTPQVLADLIGAVVGAIRDEGIDTELSAVIPSAVDPKDVNELLGKELLAHIKDKGVVIGPQKGGIELKLLKENITLDLTDSALLELAVRFVRKDFHKYFFAKQ